VSRVSSGRFFEERARSGLHICKQQLKRPEQTGYTQMIGNFLVLYAYGLSG
jgi:hypothetical protein